MLPLDSDSNLGYNDHTQKQVTGCKSEVDGLLWEQEDTGSIPVTPTHKTHFMNKMNQEIEELQSFTIEEFQADFDNLIDRVQNGESLLIQSEHGNAIMVPYNEVIRICEESNVDFEEIVKIHTDHEEGS